ncbi:acyl-CoA thioesterase [Streptomyces sp. NPDC056983]|uniref:acyl-CoA thioesterase n=1 Tax=Streptomyces sp. NPDC056983 TaxID=3345987 RepID=UPI003628D720
MAEPFTVRIQVRGYETDSQGHLNQSVYLQYAEHARWVLLQNGGIRQADLLAKGVGPVTLETNIRYRRELRAGDEVDVSCAFVWTEGKTFRIEQSVRKADGTLAAEVTGVGGLMDLKERRLVADPREYFRALASDPRAFGL